MARHKGKYDPPVPYLTSLLMNRSRLAELLGVDGERLKSWINRPSHSRMTVAEMKTLVKVTRRRAVALLQNAEQLAEEVHELELKEKEG